MKVLFVLASLILSTSSFAGSFVFTSTDTTKEAREIAADYQEYLQSGVMSLELETNIKAIMSTNDVSEQEALDMLLDSAE